jgi:D-tyrosyl-tRNA(Tyr) deacylase
MRTLVQRVARASVAIGGAVHAEIGRGLLVLAGIAPGDDQGDALDWMAGKIVRLRIFPDQAGRMNRSVIDIGGDLLVVSQFTLFADVAEGNRPAFTGAAAPEVARTCYEGFCARLDRLLPRPAGRGVFAADMQVALVNDGPVTIAIDSARRGG